MEVRTRKFMNWTLMVFMVGVIVVGSVLLPNDNIAQIPPRDSAAEQRSEGVTPHNQKLLQTNVHSRTALPSESTPEEAAVPPSSSPVVNALPENIAFLLNENNPENTIAQNDDGVAVVNNSSSTLVLVNKSRNLPSTYVPDDLTIPNVAYNFEGDHPKKQLRSIAAESLERLFTTAESDGIELRVISGYRSYATQEAIHKGYRDTLGEETAQLVSAWPGQSEHQTGLAVDISGASVNYELTPSLGESAEGLWLSDHAADFGFIIRYPKGQEDITGYSYEPWHLRYVGEELAKFIKNNYPTLEHFFSENTSTP